LCSFQRSAFRGASDSVGRRAGTIIANDCGRGIWDRDWREIELIFSIISSGCGLALEINRRKWLRGSRLRSAASVPQSMALEKTGRSVCGSASWVETWDGLHMGKYLAIRLDVGRFGGLGNGRQIRWWK
jgi:hypothetical protein